MTVFEQVIREKQNEMLFRGTTTLEREDLETLLNIQRDSASLVDKADTETSSIRYDIKEISKVSESIIKKLKNLLETLKDEELPQALMKVLTKQIKALDEDAKEIYSLADGIETSNSSLRDAALNVGFDD